MEENHHKEEEGRKHTEQSVKLFVGQVPRQMSESDLLALFAELAIVDQVNIIRDKVTKDSRGCCFVICPSREDADKAVEAFHNKKTLPGASSPLQVKYADGELERLEHKIFVGMLPKNVSEAEVSALFSQYGTIKEMQILRGSQQTSKACAFLKYEAKDEALTALEAVNGKHKMEGSNIPLVVKWADTEKERQARKVQKAFKLPLDLSQNPSLFGAVPLGYLPPYNGYGYQAPGSYGIMPYRLPSNRPPFHNMDPRLNQGNGLRGLRPDLAPGAPRSYRPTSGSYVGSGYAAAPNNQQPVAYSGRLINQRPLRTAPNSSVGASPDVSTSSKSQTEGPPGANLFIYHLPQEYGDQGLADTFQQFGRVLSAKVFIDKVTGMSKCFGFVSYESSVSAQNAISVMNGFELGGKKLKVQLKRENSKNQIH